MPSLNDTSKSGIYIIANIKSGNVYIGQTQNLKVRWQDHRNRLRRGDHPNKHLQSAWNKYNESAFKFQVLEYCSIEQLDEREQHFLNIYIPKGICYNIAKDAAAPMRGYKASDETRRKISEGKKNPSPETRLKLSIAAKNMSEERRRKIGDASRGRKLSDSAKQKLSILGKNITLEHRQKLIDSRKGKPMSEEQKQKIAAAQKGKIISEEQRQRLSEVNKGKHHSLETRQKMSESAKLERQRRKEKNNGLH